jgi:Cu/Ag efflux protein CusF
MGTGVVEALSPGEGKLRMHHDPIPALDWPSMTMDFSLAEGVSLEGLAEGDPVMFQLERSGDGYRVVAIHKHAE